MVASLNQKGIDALLKSMEHEGGRKDGGGPFSSLKNPFPPDATTAAGEREEEEKDPLVEKVEFAPLKVQKMSGQKKMSLDFFNAIPLVLSAELGTAEITVRELLKLEEGSVIKLNKLAGESASILLNNQHFGQGEVVVINDRFGLRVTVIGDGEAKESKEDNEAD